MYINENRKVLTAIIAAILGATLVFAPTVSKSTNLLASDNIKESSHEFLEVMDTDQQIRYSKNDFLCMAKNIYHEAGHESMLGKIAVAQVTINRAQNSAKTVCGVVYEPNQFSWTNAKQRPIHVNDSAWDDSVTVAMQTLEQGIRLNGMEHALYFHAVSVRPHWKNMTKLTQIGNQVFYSKRFG